MMGPTSARARSSRIEGSAVEAVLPKSARARNRLRDHRLELVRRGSLNGLPALLARCSDPDCPNIAKDGAAWTGWFTESEVELRRHDG